MTEIGGISTKNPLEMTLDEIEEEYDSLPRSAENIDAYKPIANRRRELADAYNSRQGEIRSRVGIKTKRILT